MLTLIALAAQIVLAVACWKLGSDDDAFQSATIGTLIAAGLFTLLLGGPLTALLAAAGGFLGGFNNRLAAPAARWSLRVTGVLLVLAGGALLTI